MSTQLMPTRQKNKVYRSREHLTSSEAYHLIQVAGERGRHRLRGLRSKFPLGNRTLLLMMFRHGLRAGEASLLKWDAVMFDDRNISITRLKGSESGIHRLQSDEVESLIQLKERYSGNYHLFVGERGKKLSPGANTK